MTDPISYRFASPALLEQALTHRSAGAPHNERLEFLGDALVNLIVAEALYQRWPQADEGALTRARAELVRESALAPIARELARLRRFEPLRAGDVVTHSVDGKDSTIVLRGAVGSGAPLRYSLAQAPRHGRVTIERDRATYRPDPGFAGVDTYTYRVQAGGESAEAVVAVTAIGARSLPATAAAAL